MIPVARIIIGQRNHAERHVVTALQKECARCAGCSTCAECRRIAEERDWRIISIRESTKEAIDRFLERCAYDAGDQMLYGIIYDVDLLTPSAAARLLKTLEEPHPGYRFFLTARSADRVLKTILSRCHIQILPQASELSSRDWSALIAQKKIPAALDTRMTDDELAHELSALLRQLSDAYHAAPLEQRAHIAHALQEVQRIAEIRPLPGTAAQIMRAIITFLAV
jgi:hypothetical protein